MNKENKILFDLIDMQIYKFSIKQVNDLKNKKQPYIIFRRKGSRNTKKKLPNFLKNWAVRSEIKERKYNKLKAS